MMKSLILFISLFFVGYTYATHAVGGQITYEPVFGTPNTYALTLTVYRDCGGANLANAQTIMIDNDCSLTNPSLVVVNTMIEEISQVCPSDLPNTECNGGTIPGIQKYTYSGIVTLPGICDAWTFSWQLANRNASTNVTNSISEFFYIESKLYSATNANNSSPYVTNLYQVPYVCANQSINLSSYIADVDSDSLSYQFVNALGSGGTILSYQTGYSAASPIPGITLDPVTGQMSFNVSVDGNYIVTFLIEEYRNGILQGSMMHDFQIYVEVCSNQIPVVSNIQNFNNFGTNASVSNDIITACQGDQFCFDITMTDPNLNDSIDITSDVQSIFPGATFTQTLGNPNIATICWTYQPTYFGNSFSIHGNDEVCPIPGVVSKSIHFNIPTPINLIKDSLVLCDTSGSPPVTTLGSGDT